MHRQYYLYYFPFVGFPFFLFNSRYKFVCETTIYQRKGEDTIIATQNELVCRNYLLPTYFNISMERNTLEALETHEGVVNVRDRLFINRQEGWADKRRDGAIISWICPTRFYQPKRQSSADGGGENGYKVISTDDHNSFGNTEANASIENSSFCFLALSFVCMEVRVEV